MRSHRSAEEIVDGFMAGPDAWTPQTVLGLVCTFIDDQGIADQLEAHLRSVSSLGAFDGDVETVVFDFGKPFRVEWEWIGEGMSEEYDESNPDDVPLLRCSLIDKNDEQVMSYCTLADARKATHENLEELSMRLMDQVYPNGESQESTDPIEINRVRTIMERWTWETRLGGENGS